MQKVQKKPTKEQYIAWSGRPVDIIFPSLPGWGHIVIIFNGCWINNLIRVASFGTLASDHLTHTRFNPKDGQFFNYTSHCKT